MKRAHCHSESESVLRVGAHARWLLLACVLRVQAEKSLGERQARAAMLGGSDEDSGAAGSGAAGEPLSTQVRTSRLLRRDTIVLVVCSGSVFDRRVSLVHGCGCAAVAEALRAHDTQESAPRGSSSAPSAPLRRAGSRIHEVGCVCSVRLRSFTPPDGVWVVCAVRCS